MKILHVTPHLGGGVGTVIMDWMVKIGGKDHAVMCLDTMNDKGRDVFERLFPNMTYGWNQIKILYALKEMMAESDIVLVHYWDHPMLAELFSKPIPDCRLVFWVHKNYPLSAQESLYPDRIFGTSPVQNHLDHIWSTGNMDRFLAIEPKPHKGFNIGYVGTIDYKKMHPHIFDMCHEISDTIPDVHFTFIGNVDKEILLSFFQPPPLPPFPLTSHRFTFTGKVDDVAPYLAEMDVFGYPLRPDHYGTCEIALGEAMAAGVVPVVMDNPAERTICGPVGAKNEAEFIRMVEMLYQVPEFRRCLSSMVKENSRKTYSINNMIASWNQVFEEMMKEPKKERRKL